MILISHRGNILGSQPGLENMPEYIQDTLDKGYDVEVDVWYANNELYLGHDNPQYKIDISFLMDSRLWCHAKNIEALNYMLEYDIHCFWHQEDDYSLTSKGIIWAYPNKPIFKKTICVLPEKHNQDISDEVYGICSDNILNYKK